MSKKAECDEDISGNISGWHRVYDLVLKDLLQHGDKIEFSEICYMHWGLYVGILTNLGPESSKELSRLSIWKILTLLLQLIVNTAFMVCLSATTWMILWMKFWSTHQQI